MSNVAAGYAIQICQVEWTKLSRGGRGAQIRGALPPTLPLHPETETAARNKNLSVEIFRWGESDKFARPSEKLLRMNLKHPLDFDWGAFSLQWNGFQAIARFDRTSFYLGLPTRKHQPIIYQRQIPQNGWMQFQWNGRFIDGDSFWYYQQTIVNIASISDSDSRTVFIDTQPLIQHKVMAHLF